MPCQYQVKGKPEIFGGASELLRESLWGLLSTKHSVLCISGAQRGGAWWGIVTKRPLLKLFKERISLFPGLLFRSECLIFKIVWGESPRNNND